MTAELQRFGQNKWLSSLSSIIDLNNTEKASLISSGILFEDEEEPELEETEQETKIKL